MLTVTEVEGEIRGAWDGITRPPDDRLVPAQWGEYGECFGEFRSIRWQDVTYEKAMFNRSCITFFTLNALLYYLPSFMLGSIFEREHKPLQWDLTEYTLTGIRRLYAGRDELGAAFSDANRISIRHFLELLQGYDLSREAMDDVASCLIVLD